MARLRSETNSAPPASSGESKRKKPRVTIYRNEDGSYDTSSMSEEDKARIFGGAAPAAAPADAPTDPPPPPPEPIDPQVMGLALNLLVSIEAAVVAPKLGIEHAKTFDALLPRPPISEMITNLACKVANKYGASLGPWADEIALGALIVTWQVSAFQELRRIVAENREQTAKQTPPPDRDHDRHQSPPPAPPPPPEAPAEKKVVPIDLLMGAHASTIGVEC